MSLLYFGSLSILNIYGTNMTDDISHIYLYIIIVWNVTYLGNPMLNDARRHVTTCPGTGQVVTALGQVVTCSVAIGMALTCYTHAL